MRGNPNGVQVNGHRVGSERDMPRVDAGSDGVLPVDWSIVFELRTLAAEAMSQLKETRQFQDKREEQECGTNVIAQQMAALITRRSAKGLQPPTVEEEDRIIDAVVASMYGLGRLQPLVDNPEIEDIQISGCDEVFLSYADGRVERGPAVADSDEELLNNIQLIASRLGRTERNLSAANPFLHMRLPDGSRLAIMTESTRRPEINIRRHRLREVTLTQLVERYRTIDWCLRGFLGAAVQARKNIVVTGLPGAGKTTLTRALCLQIDRMERFATVETAYELLLQDIPGRFPRLLAAEAVDAGGEITAGRRVGQVTLTDLVEQVLLMSVQRIIVGEVRGAEIGPMLEVMQLGEGGSMSTLHAKSARDAIPRMAALLARTQGLSYEAGNRWIADAVDLVVHVRYVDEGAIGGQRHRFVSEVVAVEPVADGNRPQLTSIFEPGPDGRAVPSVRPVDHADYLRAGMPKEVFDHIGVGTWEHRLATKVPLR